MLGIAEQELPEHRLQSILGSISEGAMLAE
jgi:hypothetical protein